MNAVDEKRKVLLEIADLKAHFDIKDGKQWFWQPSKTLKAVDGVTLRLYERGDAGCRWRIRLREIDLCPGHYRAGKSNRWSGGMVG